MSGAKRGCVQWQITADATWSITAESDAIPAELVQIASAGDTFYLPSLLTAIESALDGLDGSVGWTVSASIGESGTGGVTIDCDDPDWAITWTSTQPRDILGFTSNISPTAANTPQTGANHAQTVWLPDCSKWTKHGDGDDGDDDTDILYTRAPDGTVMTISGGSSRITNKARWSHVSRKRTRISGEVLTGESYQRHWRQCHRGDLAYVETGAPIRLVWDADVPGTYTTYKIIDRPGTNEPRAIEDWNGLYTVEMDLLKVPT